MRTRWQGGSCETVPGSAYGTRFATCGGDVLLDNPATSDLPFHNGSNTLSVCAVDFAGNRTCAKRTVRVDNGPPTVAFTTAQDPNDPELIRAPAADATSGISSGQIFYRPAGQTSWRPLDTRLQSGELRARIDSTVEPPGEYEFMAQVSDVAGNSAQTTNRADGQPMKLTFPLKSGVKLNAHLAPGGSRRMTLPYGQGAKAAGRLRDASGQPLAGQEVTITEYFGAGALIDRRVRTVRTDPTVCGASACRPDRLGRSVQPTMEPAATWPTALRPAAFA